jgi:NodT family efflux transporter outer membrane factor (OMF) lipoprotein
MPDAWNQKLTKGLTEGKTDMQTWWSVLNDPVLDGLIQRASVDNLDLREALWRIRESRASLAVVSGQYYPDVDAAGYYSRERWSENGLFPGTGDQINLHSIGFDSVWEIDVFGRISRSVESAGASYEASIEDYRDVLVALYAEVARNYVQMRAFEKRITYAQGNIQLQRKTLKLTQDRFDAELVPRLDVAQAELILADTESAVPALRILQTEAINRLGVLLGEQPGELDEQLSTKEGIPEPPETINLGIPAELLRQRPDIRSAERQLAAQTAQVGVATAALYPSFSLSGAFALEATDFSKMDNWSSRSYAFGPSFRWNIFDGNRVRSGIKVEEARTEQLIARYEKTVLAALEEVENAMVAYAQERDRKEALARSVVAAQESVELVQEIYRNGLTDFQNVLDMQRALSVQQDKLAESEGNVAANLIRIYKSLGGGWSTKDSSSESKDE